MATRRIQTLSLFSGGGGLDLGFAAAGYDIKCCIDNDPFSCDTLLLNAGKRSFLNHPAVICDSIERVSAARVFNETGLPSGSLEMVIGGPPCQAFSVFGRRGGLDDPRGNLVFEFLRLVEAIQPEAFVLENVPGIKTIHNGTLNGRLLDTLSCENKYAVDVHEYQVADFGIPQFRRRIFYIGTKSRKVVPAMEPTHGDAELFEKKPYVTVRDAFRKLPEPGADCDLPNHVGRKHSLRIVKRYENLAFGERDHVTRINKLNPSTPSFTIIVGSDAGGGKGHVHPYSPREVTPRESARVQSFPDWWEFSGKGRHVIRQVGNAVPPLFAAQLANHIARYVFRKRKVCDYGYFVEQMGLDYLENGK